MTSCWSGLVQVLIAILKRIWLWIDRFCTFKKKKPFWLRRFTRLATLLQLILDFIINHRQTTHSTFCLRAQCWAPYNHSASVSNF
jgi:hypothetical protein